MVLDELTYPEWAGQNGVSSVHHNSSSSIHRRINRDENHSISASPASPSPPPDMSSAMVTEPKHLIRSSTTPVIIPNVCNPKPRSTSPVEPAGQQGGNGGVQNVSILDKKYLLVEPTNSSSSSSSSGSSKSTNRSNPTLRTYSRCIKLDTKEQFTCKVIERTETGTALLAGYHRLGEGCDEISKIQEVILSSRCYYLVMPASYGNVHSYLLAKKKIKEAEAANIFRQMVLAVQFCHSKGIVLRDLKMGKFIFHDKERTLVRLDTLEDAVLLDDLNDDGLMDKHGCPNYVSPEKAEILRSVNKKYPGKATDMWGLGVMLYAMLIGRYPFQDEDHSRLFSKIRNGRVNIPDTVSTHAKFLIRCLLHKDPSKRPTCGEILNHTWLRQSWKSGIAGFASRSSREHSSGRRNASASSNTVSPPIPIIPTERVIPASTSLSTSSSDTTFVNESQIPSPMDTLFKENIMESCMEKDQVVPSLWY